jgi:hypothetical protein
VTDPSHPLARASAAIRARDDEQVIELGRPGEGDWVLFRDVAGGETVGDLLDWMAGEDPDRRRPRDVAASYLASWFDSCMVGPAATLLVLEGILPDVSPDNLWLRRHATQAWFDRIAYERTTFGCLESDAAASHPDARPVATRDELVVRLADAVVEHLAPLFAAIRADAPYGIRGMWGSLADDLAGSLTWITRRTDGDASEQRLVWEAADEILHAIAERAPLLRVRPTAVDVEWSAGSTIFCRRGTCCLFYKTPEASELGDADRYCSSCPLRDPDDQLRRWAGWLEGQAAP